MEDRVGAYNAFSMCFLTRQKLMPTHFDTAFTAHKLGAMALQNGDLGASMYGFYLFTLSQRNFYKLTNQWW